MDTSFLYRPYRSYGWFVPFTLGTAILAFVAVGYHLPRIDVTLFVLSAGGIMGASLSKMLYDLSNIAVLFEQEGVRIIGGRYTDYRYLPWEGSPYAYYTKSYKGHSFLVLSPTSLDRKQAHRLTNREANASGICVDHVAVICLDALQDVSKIKEMVEDKVLHIDAYDT